MDQIRNCESVCSSKVRIGHSLNEAESQHVIRRRETVLQCLKQHGISCSEAEVPNIAVLGSGGGLRAMVALLGSLSQLKEAGLLDCIMYLSGVSGSTWCMASLYKEPDWSTKLETVKESIVQRLAHGSVSCQDKCHKLRKYMENPNFSLTDVWAVLVVSSSVKEIDEHKLTEQRGKYANDPYPIYTVIDKHCKHKKQFEDVWFEITPDESGYSLDGAFVDSSCLGSQFKNGEKIEDQPEMDMLYLQGLCGSALAERNEIVKEICRMLKHLIKYKYDEIGQMTLPINLMTSDGTISTTELRDYTLRVCSSFCDLFGNNDVVKWIKTVVCWTWGTTYNFLNNMTVEEVDPSILRSKTREYEDAGLLLNSPYFSALRQERHIDLIISLDFNVDGTPFETLNKAAKTCKELHIPFPEVDTSHLVQSEDFYVFRGSSKVPTVIHIPLFNAVNCKGEIQKWKDRYCTFKPHYSYSDITDLLGKAGLNIKNNKEKLLEEIKNVIKEKKTSKLGKI